MTTENIKSSARSRSPCAGAAAARREERSNRTEANLASRMRDPRATRVGRNCQVRKRVYFNPFPAPIPSRGPRLDSSPQRPCTARAAAPARPGPGTRWVGSTHGRSGPHIVAHGGGGHRDARLRHGGRIRESGRRRRRRLPRLTPSVSREAPLASSGARHVLEVRHSAAVSDSTHIG